MLGVIKPKNQTQNWDKTIARYNFYHIPLRMWWFLELERQRRRGTKRDTTRKKHCNWESISTAESENRGGPSSSLS